MKEIIIDGYDLSKQNFKGMTPEQYLQLMKFQNFTCPLSGKKFEHSRVVLNDHKTGKLPDINDLVFATEEINKLKKFGPVFVHCKMSIERSPLVCIAFLMRFHKLSLENALNYLMQVHRETNPLAEQLNLLNKIDLYS